MRTIRATLVDFWSGFHNRSTLLPSPVPLPAYQSGFAAVETPQGIAPPDLPYITYDVARSPFGDFTILSGRIWTRSTSWGLVDDVLQQAAEKVPEGGLILDAGAEGCMVLYRSNPFCDYLPPEDGDPMNKAGGIRLAARSFLF